MSSGPLFGLRALAVLAALAATAARAAPLPDNPGSDHLRLSATVGASLRTLTVEHPEYPLSAGGFAPLQVRLSGAGYFYKWLGLGADASAEWFSVGKDAARARVSLVGWRASLGLAGRFVPWGPLSLEVQLGYALGGLPVVTSSALDLGVLGAQATATSADGTLRSVSVFNHGPYLTLAVGVHPDFPLSGRLWARAAPWALGLAGAPAGSTLSWFSGGVQLELFRRTVLGLAWSVALEWEATVDLAATPQRYGYSQVAQRFGLGLRAGLPVPRPARPVEVSQDTSASLAGQVVSAEGTAVWKAAVKVAGRTVTTDADGAFRVTELGSGPVTVEASAEGFRPATLTLTLAPGVEARARLTLARPTGPGALSGTVTLSDPDRPGAGAKVQVGDAAPVVCAADGAFRVEKVGPGPVKLKVTFEGYEPADEVVQIPAEAEAVLAITLANKKPSAVLRGKVSARDGVLVSATVRVKQTGQRIAVGSDGRFSVELPGGRYVLVVEAPGYVTQTRTIDVGYGDQTIYHFELRPSGR